MEWNEMMKKNKLWTGKKWLSLQKKKKFGRKFCKRKKADR